MRTKRNLLPGTLLCLVFGLAACSDGDKTADGESTDSSTTTASSPAPGTGSTTGQDTTLDTATQTTADTATHTSADTATDSTRADSYIIADHTAVDAYSSIPPNYIDIVKGWLVDAAGESHSAAYRDGMDLLAEAESTLAVQTFSSGFPDATTSALRIGRHSSVGEEDFWTNTAAIETIKNHIRAQNDAGNPIHVLFQAWCWDLTRTPGPANSGTDGYDEEFGCKWYGSSSGGPDGDHIWGLDATDAPLTGNSVSLQTYLDAIEEYNAFSLRNGYLTKAIFTTGPVDGGSSSGERGYQRFVKHEAIRNYVKTGQGRILFDYADILAWSNSGERNMLTWTSDFNNVEYQFPSIHAENDAEETGHISNIGAVRLAKAMWWLLARMAGWDGN